MKYNLNYLINKYINIASSSNNKEDYEVLSRLIELKNLREESEILINELEKRGLIVEYISDRCKNNK